MHSVEWMCLDLFTFPLGGCAPKLVPLLKKQENRVKVMRTQRPLNKHHFHVLISKIGNHFNNQKTETSLNKTTID